MNDPDLGDLVDGAIGWLQRLRAEGANWSVLPLPSVPELFPNTGNLQDAPWHGAKKKIAEEVEDLTLLWQVTPTNRPLAHSQGIIRFTDDRIRADIFNLSPERERKLQKIIDANRSYSESLISPARIAAGEEDWRPNRPLEFFVDFETVSDLDDDFSKMPVRGGQALIFMIGCGHMEDGKWIFKVFTCDHLTLECEREIIDAWHAHMAAVRDRLSPSAVPLVYHWSHAEVSTLSGEYKSAETRHGSIWPKVEWYDFLSRVMREEPVSIRGCLAFGLKNVARAMHRHGLIETCWSDGPGDGLAAMVGAWRCDEAARSEGGSMRDLPLMAAIEEYNEVDCRVMQQIIAYLRTHH
jgi:hypothetical protein